MFFWEKSHFNFIIFFIFSSSPSSLLKISSSLFFVFTLFNTSGPNLALIFLFFFSNVKHYQDLRKRKIYFFFLEFFFFQRKFFPFFYGIQKKNDTQYMYIQSECHLQNYDTSQSEFRCVGCCIELQGQSSWTHHSTDPWKEESHCLCHRRRTRYEANTSFRSLVDL